MLSSEDENDVHGMDVEHDTDNDWSELTQINSTPNERVLVPKKNSTSDVWLYFGFDDSDKDQANILCRFCKKTVGAKGGNTTNLYQHLKIHHPTKYTLCKHKIDNVKTNQLGFKKRKVLSSRGSSQMSLQDSFPYVKNSQKWTAMTNAVTHFLAKDMIPIYTVEKAGFKKLLKTFDPRYILPGRKYFSNVAIPALYNTVHDKVLEEIRSRPVGYFGATTDLWSSRNMEPYMGFTLHFIDAEWNLKSRHLETLYFPSDHTAENLASGLQETLEAWNLLEADMVCLTTDNGSNIVKAASLNDYLRLQCFGHRLNLAINNALKDQRIERAVASCKKIVSAFSFAFKKKRELLKIQRKLELPEHCLISSCDTRWGSLQAMIGRYLEQEKAVTQVLTLNRKSLSLIPTWQTVSVLESVNKALAPLAEFTDALSGEDYVSISSVIPVLHLLNTEILKSEVDETEMTKEIKSKVLKYLNDKYSDESESRVLLEIATLMDPRYKDKFICPNKLSEIRETIVDFVVTNEKIPPTTSTPSTSSSQTTGNSSQNIGTPSQKAKISLGKFFKRRESSESDVQLSVEEKTRKELERYLLLPPIEYEEEPLSWWKDNCLFYPNLALCARKYLCVPATSCASERLFSTSGNVVTCSRTRLKPTMVNMLVFLAKNLD